MYGLVHPRVCGEHLYYLIYGFFNNGSSPRVRGTLFAQTGPLEEERFIPACAGNIDRIIDRAKRISVHPRVCGEHFPIAGNNEF